MPGAPGDVAREATPVTLSRLVPSDAEARRALRAWVDGERTQITRIPRGVVNDTWKVEGQFVRGALRRHRRSYRPLVELEHAAADFARERGIPSPTPLRTRGRTRYHEEGGIFWTLYDWAPGLPLRRMHLSTPGIRALTASEARLMGEWLGRLHNVLSNFSTVSWNNPYAEALGWRDRVPRHDALATLAAIDEIVGAIDALPDVEADRQARAGLISRRNWIESHRDFEPPPPSEPQQLIHGDYQPSNFFVSGGQLTSLIDWDEVHVNWPSLEVVSTCAINLALEPQLVAAFIGAYRRHRDLPNPLLEEAVLYCSWDWAHWLWAHQMVYLEGDARLRSLVDGPPFLPLHERWPIDRQLAITRDP